MKKIILSILAILSILSIAGIIYLNEVILPQKIKSILLKGFETATGKKIELSGAKLGLFKGLVLKDVIILDNDVWMIKAKEVCCRFLIIPLFKKEIIVTSVRLDSPDIFVERESDNSINIVETFFKGPILLNGEYRLSILRIILSRAGIILKDNIPEPAVTKDLKKVYLDVHISLPDRIYFDSEFEVPAEISMLFKVHGEYKESGKKLSVEVNAKDLQLKIFEPYLKDRNIVMPDGRADIEARIKADKDTLGADIILTSLGLSYSPDKIKASLNCGIKAHAEYDFNKKSFIYSGDMNIKNLSLSGLEYLDRIDDIRGQAAFTESRITAKDITCTVAGLRINAAADLTDFKAGVLNINIASVVELSMLKDLLDKKFKMKLPADMKGAGDLKLKLEYRLPVKEMPVINGDLNVSGADITLDYNKTHLTEVDGMFTFTSNQLSWTDLAFRYMKTDYTSSGVVTNFEKPGIDIKLDSEKLSLWSLLALNDTLLTISKFDGVFEGLEFSLSGDLDTADPSNLMAELNGVVKFDLDEKKEPFKRLSGIFINSKLAGILTAKFALKGSLNDPGSCDADVEASSARISIYGLKLEDFAIKFMQRKGIVDIARLSASLYGGSLGASGRIDMTAKDTPYQINAEIKDLSINKIKIDTAFKDYDISGIIQSRFGFKGYKGDVSRLSAWGKIHIAEGKLWQLDLFRGIGTLVFRKDFSSVVFKDGDCDFSIKDKTIVANDIILRSDLVNIMGAARIGFDNSITASLKTEFTDEGVDAAKISDVLGGIERYSIIDVSGTLKEPKIRLSPDLSNVMSDLAEGLFQR